MVPLKLTKRINRHGIPILDPPKNGRLKRARCPKCGFWNYNIRTKSCSRCINNLRNGIAFVRDYPFAEDEENFP